MSATPYKTPTRRPLAHRQPQSAKAKAVDVVGLKAAKAVDVVTGKAIVEYFFDPTLVMANDESGLDSSFKTPSSKNLSKSLQSDDDMMYSSKHLFMPCTIVKRLEEDKEGNGAKSVNTEPYSGPTLTKTSDGMLHRISDSSKLIPLSAPEDYIGEEDVLHLPHVTEASLLHTLRIRYKRDEIYTSAGPILISVNPYKTFTMPDGDSPYSEKLMMQYRTKSGVMGKPPHLFQVADRAYTSLMDSIHSSMEVEHMEDEDAVMLTENHTAPGHIRNQSIIISGESGAGKTEATKSIMQYLARITKRPTTTNPNPLLSPDGKQMIAALEDRVLSSNPLLETFGNAQTLRNDNSSRFGKFIHIYFSTTTGTITGASISNYLLEKTRITTQVEGERNYHIFYQLLAGADPAMLAEFGIENGAASFNYLSDRTSSGISAADASEFVQTQECLTQIGLSEDEQRTLFGMVAGVLHLGNVQFEEKGEDGDPGNSEHARITEASLPSLKKACELLGLKEAEVADAILTKNLLINGKTIKKAQTVDMAAEKRDALAKMTYSCIFLWLVTSVNETLDVASGSNSAAQNRNGSEALPPGVSSRGSRKNWASVKNSPIDGSTDPSSVFIGVLDIYGFESFEENGFEQLLINYCNEKMQRHFNRHLFEVEQALYSSEGVDWTYISFNDNRPCLELIEGGRGTVGVLNHLDDAWGGMGNSSEEKDIKFVNQLKKAFSLKNKDESKDNTDSSQNYFQAPKFGNDRQFIIVHFAGKVTYTADGFVEKNMETLSTELRQLGYESPVPLAQSVFVSAVGGLDGIGCSSPKRSSIRGVSVGSQFRASLQNLVSDLESTQPHYIRCIKPNLTKSPNAFSSGEVLKQLRYSGMMEAIRIRREGYSLREEHESFYNRFSVLLSQEDLEGGAGIENLVKILSKRLSVTDADWQIGHSKIFLRRELSDKLEKLAKLRVHAAARTVGRFGKIVAHKGAAKLLCQWARFRLIMRKFYRELKATNKINAASRGFVQRRNYTSIREAVIKVQTQQRRIIAVDYVRKVRDPYIDMTFKDMKGMLAKEKSRLEEAVSAKNFKKAAELESKVDEITEAMEAKRPLTRAVLEGRIGGLQKKLADVLERKEYSECEPIQQQIDELTRKREELPTIAELREAVRAAEDAVAVAASKRDFSGAAMGQARIDEAKKRLEEALSADGGSDSEDEGKTVGTESPLHGFESRADLEEAITSMRLEVEQAIASKDFKKASTLQESLDAKKKLRALFPSIDELEIELKSKKEQQEAAIAEKDFAKAGQLHEVIDCLEEKIKKEEEKMVKNGGRLDAPLEASVVGLDGSMKVFETRSELEGEISKTALLVQDAVSSKQFQKAEEMNSFVEKLEQMRKRLPTFAEMEEELRSKRKEMEEAVAKKKFTDAERISQAIDVLEKKVENERKNQPAPVVQPKVPSVAPTKSPKQPKVQAAKAKTTNVGDSQSVHSVPVARGLKMNGDSKSVHSVPVKSLQREASKTESSKSSSTLVSKLRPKKPVICTPTDSVLEVTQMLSSKRSDATLVVDNNGSLCGITTDVDVVRRVVAKSLDPTATDVSVIMTPNPTCVSMSDSAMDALGTMISNHFRHLPVVDDSGAVVGLLDISKCLHDAIEKLEKADTKNKNVAGDVMSQVLGQQTSSDAHALALQALLSQVMSHALGNQSLPTLGSLLAGKPPLTVVEPETSVQEAALLMAEHRKAALVVENGRLAGIVSFKDVMTRVVAKDLSPESTSVSTVMTENPEFVSPDMTVLEALQTMHENRFLTLPVCDSDGRVAGIVDCISLINACGGENGWRSIFTSAMDLDIDDDASETGSVKSYSSRNSRKKHAAMQQKSSAGSMSMLAESQEERPVSKLRPKKPMISGTSDSVLAVVQMLASKRSDASLVVDESGMLAGIVTDIDVCRRVVAKSLDPISTSVSDVMTPNPTCVVMSDSAMEAMSTMLEHHFRHLPVLDDDGAVVGVLDIAKCLHDAISKLEKSVQKKSSSVEDVVKQVVNQQGSGGAQAAALQTLLSQVMSQAFGNQSSPTLGSLLTGPPLTVVGPDTSVHDAGMLMAAHRKAALVVEDGELLGIFGFKDLMTRAVAKGLPLDSTPVSVVMTASPETVSADTTVLQAMQVLHDHNFKTLPICDSDGSVKGIVDCMDLILACGGKEGWRSIFSRTIELDDFSDGASLLSAESGLKSAKGSVRSKGPTAGRSDDKTVSRLRPKKPILSTSNDSVLDVCQLLCSKRADASLVVDETGMLAGIVTDIDVCRRVVAKSLDPVLTQVSDVMTRDPTCVSTSDLAMDAMATMVQEHFRHLPVLDDDGSVVGLLDLAKCLHDAIAKLEKSVEKKSSNVDDVVKQVVNQQGSGGAQAAALQMLLSQVMTQAFGNQSSPTLGSLLVGKPPLTVVGPDTSVRDAGMLMAAHRKAALVLEDDELVGLFSFKDLLNRAVAKGLSLDTTPVSAVMTPNPDSVSADTTVLEAMQVLHDNRFSQIPVHDNNGTIGVVDCMDLILACGGKEGWRSIFSSALDDTDGISDVVSATQSRITAPAAEQRIVAPPMTPRARFPENIPMTLEFEDGVDDTSTIQDTRMESKSMISFADGASVFKVVCPEGNTHRVRCELQLGKLIDALAEKGMSRSLQLQFIDDEGDAIVVTSDDCLAEAAGISRTQGHKVIKLTAKIVEPKRESSKLLFFAGAGVAVVAAGAAVAFFVTRPRR